MLFLKSTPTKQPYFLFSMAQVKTDDMFLKFLQLICLKSMLHIFFISLVLQSMNRIDSPIIPVPLGSNILHRSNGLVFIFQYRNEKSSAHVWQDFSMNFIFLCFSIKLLLFKVSYQYIHLSPQFNYFTGHYDHFPHFNLAYFVII